MCTHRREVECTHTEGKLNVHRREVECTQKGSHWASWYKDGKYRYYFDSYGESDDSGNEGQQYV